MVKIELDPELNTYDYRVNAERARNMRLQLAFSEEKLIEIFKQMGEPEESAKFMLKFPDQTRSKKVSGPLMTKRLKVLAVMCVLHSITFSGIERIYEYPNGKKTLQGFYKKEKVIFLKTRLAKLFNFTEGRVNYAMQRDVLESYIYSFPEFRGYIQSVLETPLFNLMMLKGPLYLSNTLLDFSKHTGGYVLTQKMKRF